MRMGELHIGRLGQDAMLTARNRLLCPMIFFFIGFTLLIFRVVDLAFYEEGGQSGIKASEKVASVGRADIIDRNGVILASSLDIRSLAVNTKYVINPKLIADQIHTILPELNYAKLLNRLTVPGKYTYLKWKLTPKQTIAINSLGYPALLLDRAKKRAYPHGNLFSHILGYVVKDGRALSGVERFYDDVLKSDTDTPLQLSLDVRVQHIVRREIGLAMEKFNAIGGVGIVMDINSGELLAMSSLPDFNPNFVNLATDDEKFNRATGGVYELGSGFKSFTTALALDQGFAKMGTRFDARTPIKVDRFTIRDDHAKNAFLNVAEIFTHSSNIGTVLLSQEIGKEAQVDFLSRLGLFKKTTLEIGGQARPLIPKYWGEAELATVAFGHGIAVTPVHLVTGVSAMMNGGNLISATLIKQNRVNDEMQIPNQEGLSNQERLGGQGDFKVIQTSYSTEDDETAQEENRIISAKTSQQMRDLFRLVVERGTGKRAQTAGYAVGGKTGTAEKPKNGNYLAKDVISSFVGAFPMEDPKYIVMVLLDEPRGNVETHGFISAGWTAAPIAREIISQIGPILGVIPIGKRPLKYVNYLKVSGH